MKKLTTEETDGLIANTLFLHQLKERAGEPKQRPATYKQVLARRVMVAMVALDKAIDYKPNGLLARLCRVRLAATMHSYLSAHDEASSTYLPEGN
jgi:hypothetical protein